MARSQPADPNRTALHADTQMGMWFFCLLSQPRSQPRGCGTHRKRGSSGRQCEMMTLCPSHPGARTRVRTSFWDNLKLNPSSTLRKLVPMGEWVELFEPRFVPLFTEGDPVEQLGSLHGFGIMKFLHKRYICEHAEGYLLGRLVQLGYFGRNRLDTWQLQS